MSAEVIGLILLFSVLAFCMAIKMPIAFSLGVSAVIAALYLDIPLYTLFQKMVTSLNSFVFLAVPFFILAAQIMTDGGIAGKLMQVSNAMVGRVRGGTAMVNIVVSMFFGGISGSSVADVSSIGAFLIPVMEKEGYDKGYSTAVTVTSSVQGVIIPPSQNMIYYAVAAGGLSISKLFIAGYIPGILLGVVLMIVAYYIAVKRKYPKGLRIPFRQKLHVFADGAIGLFAIVIIIGGVVFGIFTATESAAVAAVYGILVTILIYKTMNAKKIVRVLLSSSKILATILAIIAMSAAFGYILAYLQVPKLVFQALISLSENPIYVMLLINAVLLVLGMFMDMGVLILLLTPILLPVALSLGYDPYHFGIIMILNLGIGLCTPPVGTSLFVGCAIAKLPIGKAIRDFLPFYGAMICLLLLIIFIPQLVTWLPGLIKQ